MEARSPAHLALGQALRAIREAKAHTQESLALEIGLNRTYVGAVERGERNASYRSLLKIANGLEVHLSVIIADAERRLDQST